MHNLDDDRHTLLHQPPSSEKQSSVIQDGRRPQSYCGRHQWLFIEREDDAEPPATRHLSEHFCPS